MENINSPLNICNLIYYWSTHAAVITTLAYPVSKIFSIFFLKYFIVACAVTLSLKGQILIDIYVNKLCVLIVS